MEQESPLNGKSRLFIFNRLERAKSGANHEAKRLVLNGESHRQANEFDRYLADNSLTLKKSKIDILQINVGKLCNLTCEHCHVEAGPNRTEIMTDETLDVLLNAANGLGVKIVDLTGGAPEMCPGFREYVKGFRGLGCEVIVRSNLTILMEVGYEDMADFFAEQKVRVIASLPCYSEENVDKQRGDGVFKASIEALKKLNAVGYGSDNSGLVLDLVFNPGGPSLPAPQAKLQAAYKEKLDKDFGIKFNSLFAITNLPIGRFYSDLKKQGKAEAYDQLLRDNFNSGTVPQLMCVNTLNVSWDGWLYDCDFNQMLEMPLVMGGKPMHISDYANLLEVENLGIATGNHCFGCTAGAGSSCTGELV
jgi:radical SAM/Cys-rich protein